MCVSPLVCKPEFSAAHNNTIIGTRVVVEFTNEDVGNITDATLLVGVILAGACLPDATIVDMGFPRRVFVPKGPSRDDRDWILEIGNADECIQFAVDEIGEILVSDLKKWRGAIRMGSEGSNGNMTHTRQSISIELNGAARHVEL